jgi:hypothetical protein
VVVVKDLSMVFSAQFADGCRVIADAQIYVNNSKVKLR